MYLLDDLIHVSERFRDAARDGDLVYEEDFTVGSGQDRWNADLVIGPPADDTDPEQSSGERAIVEGEPSEIWLSVDAKSVMTEHGKARRNRQRDINSFADVMHQHYPGAVTAGILLLNMAEQFRSPLRDEGDITEHDRIEQLIAETIEIFRTIDRSGGDISHDVDGVATVVVEHTNMDDGTEPRLVTDPPAPQPGDIVHYRDFVHLIGDVFENRFLVGGAPDVEDATNAERLRHELNQRAVEVARLAYELGSDLGDLDLDAETVDELRTAAETVGDLADEAEEEFT